MSEQFDAAAARLLQRAHMRHGDWTGTYVANPSPQWMAWGARHGVNLLGRDDAGSGSARTMWCRSFVRSLYYVHRNFYYAGKGVDLADKRVSPRGPGSLRFEVGTVRIAPGGKIMGRAVRVRLQAGGQAADRAVLAMPQSRRIYLDDGAKGPRFAEPSARWWV